MVRNDSDLTFEFKPAESSEDLQSPKGGGSPSNVNRQHKRFLFKMSSLDELEESSEDLQSPRDGGSPSKEVNSHHKYFRFKTSSLDELEEWIVALRVASCGVLPQLPSTQVVHHIGMCSRLQFGNLECR